MMHLAQFLLPRADLSQPGDVAASRAPPKPATTGRGRRSTSTSPGSASAASSTWSSSPTSTTSPTPIRGSLAPAIRNATQAPEHDPDPAAVVHGGGDAPTIGLGATYLGQPPASRSTPRRLWATLDHLTGGRAAWNVVTIAQPQPVGQLRRGAQADRRALRPRARIHRGLPQAVGQLGRGRRRDGPRRPASSPIRPRCIASSMPAASSSRAARSTSCARRSTGRRILQAGTSRQGPRLRGALRRRGLRHPAQPRGRQGATTTTSSAASSRPAAGRRPARSCSASSRSSAPSRRRGRETSRTEHNSAGAARGRPRHPVRAISISTSRPCRSTRSWRIAASPSCSGMQTRYRTMTGELLTLRQVAQNHGQSGRPAADGGHAGRRRRPARGLFRCGRRRRLHAVADLFTRRDRGIRRSGGAGAAEARTLPAWTMQEPRNATILRQDDCERGIRTPSRPSAGIKAVGRLRYPPKRPPCELDRSARHASRVRKIGAAHGHPVKKLAPRQAVATDLMDLFVVTACGLTFAAVVGPGMHAAPKKRPPISR